MCRNRRAWFGVLTAVLLPALAGPGGFGAEKPLAEKQPAEKPPAEAQPDQPEGIRQGTPTFLVRADVNHGTRVYRERDHLSITVASEADAYVYVLYKQADGKIFLIYPNSEQPNNRVNAKQAVRIPANDDLFTWIVEPPFGKEVIKVIASRERLPELSDPALREKFFNPITPQQVKGIKLRLGPQAPPWAEDYVEITTYEANKEVERSGTRRFAVLFGVGEYEFHDEMRAVSDGKTDLNTPPCHRDARRLAAILSEVGQFADVRLYTNDQVTRQQMAEALTQWLPSVSRPGDTVLVFFSGLAVPLGDEQSGRRSAILAPHDFMPLPVLEFLVAKAEKVGVSRGLVPRIKAAIAAYERAGGGKTGGAAVAQATAVGEDLLAHWLQALAGRQVIVILDTGVAGAFLPPGLTAGTGAKAALADLSNPVGRLQGLGQQEIAFLGACGPQQGDVLRASDELSLLTHYLVTLLASVAESVSLEQAHQVVVRSMEELFTDVNRKRQADGKQPVPAYQPILVNTCSRPALLKP